MGRVPQVDPDQFAALRRLRAAFGFVQVLKVIDHQPSRDPAPDCAPQDGLVDGDKPSTDDG